MKPARLILAAHGHGDGSPANEIIERLAQHLARELTAVVTAAFNMGTPGFAAAARDVDGPAVVLPIMTSDGYFVRGKVAGAFAAAPYPVAVAPPIGIDLRLRDAAAADFTAAIRDRQPELALVVGHGTRRSRTTSITTRSLAARMAAELPGIRVETAYLDQPPLLEDVIARAGGRTVAVLPWLIGGGGHDLADVFERTGAPLAAPRGRWLTTPRGPLLIGRPLAELDAFDTLALDAARRALARPVLRLGTRRSRLALWQAHAAANALAARGVPTEIVEIDTAGDRDLVTPIASVGGSRVFTDDLEDAIADGRIDAAVHSLKDLPIEPTPGFVIPAMLERGRVEEALVSRRGLTLAELPAGAVVGTSSERRRRRLLELRPDLTVAPIRGPVDARVAQVDAGRFDAAILALAGLERLGLAHRASEIFDPAAFPHDAGQGVIALQCAAGDADAIARLARADHAPTRAVATAELDIARRQPAATA